MYANTIHCSEHDIWHMVKHASRTVIVKNLPRQPHSCIGRPSHRIDVQHLSTGVQASWFVGWTRTKDKVDWFMFVRISFIPKAKSLTLKYVQVIIKCTWGWTYSLTKQKFNGDPVIIFSPAEFLHVTLLGLRQGSRWAEIGQNSLSLDAINE